MDVRATLRVLDEVRAAVSEKGVFACRISEEGLLTVCLGEKTFEANYKSYTPGNAWILRSEIKTNLGLS